VILNIEDYERMRRQADVRTVGTLETMSDTLLDEMEEAVDAYARDDESARS